MDVERGGFRIPGVPQKSAPTGAAAPQSAALKPADNKKPSKGGKKLWGTLLVVLAVVLIAGLVYSVFFSSSKETAKLDENAYQAVFLADGQVYFGNVTDLSDDYIELSNVFYLNVNSAEAASDADNNVSLVKLGCELHGPVDVMFINRSTVTFWENLKDSGKVAQAIDTWKSQNPNGQDCTAAANSGSQQQADPSATPQTGTDGQQ